MPKSPPRRPRTIPRFIHPDDRADEIDVEVTRRTWDPIYQNAGKPPLTDEDAREIFESMSGLKRLLDSMGVSREPDPDHPGQSRFVRRERPVEEDDE